ncbi:hypothetical protein ILUMI_14654 [Ignelater luminosus]|uniref:Uncharacterized protein n=1 Tax=Ignelater luminosus TaxID=2038154 RepID=A0A8K0CQ30_IGNLU|nr:hypothetical protein ILUMI_14654 [Ignelater luminosus]
MDGNRHQVCQKRFTSMFSVSQRTLHTICKKIMEETEISEKRDGDRRTAKHKEENQEEFIYDLNTVGDLQSQYKQELANPVLGWIVPIFTENQEDKQAGSATDEECECDETDNVDFV